MTYQFCHCPQTVTCAPLGIRVMMADEDDGRLRKFKDPLVSETVPWRGSCAEMKGIPKYSHKESTSDRAIA